MNSQQKIAGSSLTQPEQKKFILVKLVEILRKIAHVQGKSAMCNKTFHQRIRCGHGKKIKHVISSTNYF